jgi:hypothetical protein
MLYSLFYLQLKPWINQAWDNLVVCLETTILEEVGVEAILTIAKIINEYVIDERMINVIKLNKNSIKVNKKILDISLIDC